MSDFQFNPFDGLGESDTKDSSHNQLIHIRIQQRNGKKMVTTVQGLHSKYDLKKIVKYTKKKFACNGTVVDHPEYGEVIQYQGDQRDMLCNWLVELKIVDKNQIKLHGF